MTHWLMMDYTWLINIAVAFLLCVVITGFLIPKILLISFRCNLFDEVDERKIHKGIVPRLGGIAFMPAILLSIAFVLGLNGLFGKQDVLTFLMGDELSVTFGICGVLILYLVGLADDLIGVRYRAKFYVQIVCAILLICGNLWINDFHGVFGIHEVPWWVGYPLTVLVVVFVTNAINLIDGIDGLASGLSSITMLIYGLYSYQHGDFIFAMIAFSALGVLMPFFYYNVFGDAAKHKKIFMGDTGTLTIGFIISFLGLKLLHNEGEPPCALCGNPLVLVIAPMIIPCFDVVRVYLGRVRNHKNPFLPDKTHIHHKLLAIGMTQRKAMMTIVGSSLLLSFLSIGLSSLLNVNLLILLGAFIFTYANIWLTKLIRRRRAAKKLKELLNTENVDVAVEPVPVEVSESK